MQGLARAKATDKCLRVNLTSVSSPIRSSSRIAVGDIAAQRNQFAVPVRGRVAECQPAGEASARCR